MECFCCLAKKSTWSLFLVPLWLMRGRAHLKSEIARRIIIDAHAWPLNSELLGFLQAAKHHGRKLVLATAADQRVATAMQARLNLFDEIVASDGQTNLRGQEKLHALQRKFGPRGFDYAGNSAADLVVWRGARAAIIVNGGERLSKKAAADAEIKIEKVFDSQPNQMAGIIRSLRPHQWVKNLIVFVPIVAAHKVGEWPLLVRDAQAFAIFCCCASGVYLINDLMDLDSDRSHRRKRERPFAAGVLPLQYGLAGGPLFLLAGLAGAAQLSWLFLCVTGTYLVLTTAYSSWIKRVVLLDVFVLAGLYTIRLVAGHVATSTAFSPWLMIFSIFIFLSLALVKRQVELAGIKTTKSGRGYVAEDLQIVTSLGTGSGYLAALVLALYVNSQQVVALYAHPNVLLLLSPLLLYWISRIWLLAHRGQMHDDPVFFAVKDLTSYVVAAIALLVMWMATGR